MKLLEEISDELAGWMHAQHLFFVATAPLSGEGHVNCSPKGGDAFRVLGPLEAAYVDYTGSGAETIAHIRENGRLLIMFCAFDGPPNIVRLHGQGEVLLPDHSDFDRLVSMFPGHAGTRSVIRLQVTRVSTSCGFGVPLMDFREDRVALRKWAENKEPGELEEYWERKNLVSIDGLAALPIERPKAVEAT